MRMERLAQACDSSDWTTSSRSAQPSLHSHLFTFSLYIIINNCRAWIMRTCQKWGLLLRYLWQKVDMVEKTFFFSLRLRKLTFLVENFWKCALNFECPTLIFHKLASFHCETFHVSIYLIEINLIFMLNWMHGIFDSKNYISTLELYWAWSK